ncbi:MAG: DUF3301 domain-containing protein [Methylobacter sp.]
MAEFVLIALLLTVCLCWIDGLSVREIAFKAVRANCLKLEVQMLDEYVALSRIELKQDRAGKMRLQRAFLFEFSSTGNERYNGVCIMLGRRVESIHMEPYRVES